MRQNQQTLICFNRYWTYIAQYLWPFISHGTEIYKKKVIINQEQSTRFHNAPSSYWHICNRVVQRHHLQNPHGHSIIWFSVRPSAVAKMDLWVSHMKDNVRKTNDTDIFFNMLRPVFRLVSIWSFLYLHCVCTIILSKICGIRIMFFLPSFFFTLIIKHRSKFEFYLGFWLFSQNILLTRPWHLVYGHIKGTFRRMWIMAPGRFIFEPFLTRKGEKIGTNSRFRPFF